MDELTKYIIDFLARFSVSETGAVYYGKVETAPLNAKIVIIPAFTNFEITSLPQIPFEKIDNTPVLFGNSQIEMQNGIKIIYADIIISSFFLLSRYEEILKLECRDKYGRFLAKDSVIFQQGYGNRPLVDEYGCLFRKWLREAGVDVPADKKGFSKIYLTHDVDDPFPFGQIIVVLKQYIKNLLRHNYISSPLKKYFIEKHNKYNTFTKIINYDKALQRFLPNTLVESVYFLITAGSFFNRKYYNFFSRKVNHLIDFLKNSSAKFGLHVSHEAGKKPEKIINEAKNLKEKFGFSALPGRHHFLQWCEPSDILFMERAGINDDFTLSYADSAGFRVGTCHPYRFINPQTKELTNVTIYPLEIMECTLNRQNYMNLDYEDALCKCKEIIDQVFMHNGELVLLWHNTEFLGENYQEKLYEAVLEYVKGLY